MTNPAPDLEQRISRIMRDDRGRLLAALIRSLNDFDLAEDAPSVTLELSEVSRNTASKQGGGAIVEGGSLSCEAGSIEENMANEGGGVLLDLGSSLVSSACDWGEAGSTDDNDPSDVRVVFEDYSDFGTAESFTCDEEGCE